jgi:hypothetical protein
MISIFPVRPFALLPLIKFLPSPSRDQLNRIRYDPSFAVVSDKEVDVVGGHNIVEYAQAEALLGLEEPLEIPAAVSVKF